MKTPEPPEGYDSWVDYLIEFGVVTNATNRKVVFKDYARRELFKIQDKAKRYDKIVAIMPAYKFSLLAKWLDKIDADRGRAKSDEVQQDLRKIRDVIDPSGNWDVEF